MNAETKTLRFDTWEEYLSFTSKPSTISSPTSSDTSHEIARWTWTDSYRQAMTLAGKGWREGAEKLRQTEKLVAGRIPQGTDIIPQYDVAGDEADVGRYLEGDPENMVAYELQPARKPVVKFVVSFSISSRVKADSIFNRGAAIAAAIDALESSGLRCEVWAARDTKGRGGRPVGLNIRVRIKGADESLDTDRLAFALCHPSNLRRLSMRINEVYGQEYFERLGGHGYGYPVDPKREGSDEDAIILGCVISDGEWANVDSAAMKAKELIVEAERIVGNER